MERVFWWSFFILFLGTLIVGALFLPAAVSSSPEIAAFLLGLLGFWLFANRLIFGYAQIANAASSLKKGEEIKREEIAQKALKNSKEISLREFSGLESKRLLLLWKGALEPFKYSYYFGFFLVFLLVALLKVGVVSFFEFVPVAEALILGATIPTLAVWSLELLSDCYLQEIFKE